MAVETHHLRLFTPQQQTIARNWDTINAMQNHHLLSAAAAASAAQPMIYVAPTTTVSGGSFVPNDTFNDVSSLAPAMKRQRVFSFLGEDVSSQLLQQQIEIDRIVCQHMERVRSEVGEQRKRFSNQIREAMEERMRTRLRAKEEEIERIGKLNFALEDRIRNMTVENQIWRDLAQTNEAAANILRGNLEQVLAGQHMSAGGAAIDDAESFCIGDVDREDDSAAMKRFCRQCGKREPTVLLLPCRHLCICVACSPVTKFCPVCKSCKKGSVLVNMS